MKVIHALLSLAVRLIPRSRNILVFSSFPDYTDNAFAMQEYLKKNRPGKYKCIWLYSDKESVGKYPGVKGYYKYTVKAFYYYARARYVFSTHGIFDFLKFNSQNKIVNLWHGMPLKRIGCMDANGGGVMSAKADYLIATSPFFQDIMAKSFNNISLDKVLVVGQPRNDLMYEKSDFFSNRNIDTSSYKSIGIWLPTYRQSIIGDIRRDGVFNEDGISFLSMDDLHRLDGFLQENASLLIVKLHPMDALQEVDFGGFKNLVIVKPKELREPLYPLLGACHYLLTDYSSVWIDYCILKRPIGFVMNDVEEYKDSRGLTIENLDENLPGYIVDTYGKLTEFIECLPQFKEVNSELFNLYCDNKASERLARVLNL